MIYKSKQKKQMKHTLTILLSKGVEREEIMLIGSKFYCQLSAILHRIMYGKKLAKEGVEVFYEITETRLMKTPYIPAQAVRHFCISLGLFPNWKNIRLCWQLLILAKMDTADVAAELDK